uniref:Predicted protein n=1 Tax=Physcomitrium patens TaxID=3218 RepID=A9U5G7_PHYPA
MTCCCPVSDLIPTRYLLPSGGRYGEAWSEVWGGFVRPVVLDVDSRTCPRSCAEFDAIGVVFPSASLEVCVAFAATTICVQQTVCASFFSSCILCACCSSLLRTVIGRLLSRLCGRVDCVCSSISQPIVPFLLKEA